jgi:hypothetical protein
MYSYRFYPSDLTKGLLGLAVSYGALVYAIRKLNSPGTDMIPKGE